MGALTVNGVRCVTATMTIPRWGAWVADVALATAEGPAQGERVEFKIGAITAQGTARRGGALAGARRARIVAGGAGWRKVLAPKSYNHVAGVRRSDVLADAARESGERASLGADAIIGTSFVRDRGKAERVLKYVSGGAWYVDFEGTTQVRDREASAIGSPFTVIARHGERGRFEIATEAPQDWLPGRTFFSPTVPDVQTISSVTYQVDEDGKLRVVVLAEDSERDRLLADIRAIVRAEIGEVTYAGLWEYEVVAATDKTFDGTPTDARMPAIRGCPILLPGRVAVEAGSRAVVAFINSDPARPVCLHVWGKALEHLATVEAVAVFVHNVLANLCAVHGIFIGPAVMPTIAAAIAGALTLGGAPAPPLDEAQALLGPTLGAAMLAGTPGNALPDAYKQVIALLLDGPAPRVTAKQPNFRGYFPGLGMPAQKDGP